MKIRGQKVYPLKERLERLSESNSETGCIEWKSSNRNGYGRLTIGSRNDGTRRSVSAHRLSFELHNGPIPEGFLVCHKCDNPKCINPEHLFLGTQQDNVDDRERKGRNNPSRKLTAEDYDKIKTMKASRKDIAAMFGIGFWTVKAIRSGKYPRPSPPKGKTP